MPEAASASPLEAYVLLANGAKGAAAIGLIQQVLEASTVYVFGELLDHPNIKDLETNGSTPNAKGYYDLLNLFAYGTYNEYLASQAQLPGTHICYIFENMSNNFPINWPRPIMTKIITKRIIKATMMNTPVPLIAVQLCTTIYFEVFFNPGYQINVFFM